MIQPSVKATQENIKKVLKHFKFYEIILRSLRSKLFRYSVLFFIVIAIAAIILSSFKKAAPYSSYLFSIIYFSAIVFTIEYVLRIIAAPASRPEMSAFKARMHYIFSFYGFVDFIAMLPFLLVYMLWNTEISHLIILPYIFIVFKLIRYSKSFQLIGRVLNKVRDELITSYTACLILICFMAIMIYYLERKAQPDAFSNIGDGLWYSIVTFTTVGYGDLTPITPLGRILSSLISLIGISMIALPTGIVSSAFMDEMQKRKAAVMNSGSDDDSSSPDMDSDGSDTADSNDKKADVQQE